jgi:hypothetical protein
VDQATIGSSEPESAVTITQNALHVKRPPLRGDRELFHLVVDDLPNPLLREDDNASSRSFAQKL